MSSLPQDVVAFCIDKLIHAYLASPYWKEDEAALHLSSNGDFKPSHFAFRVNLEVATTQFFVVVVDFSGQLDRCRDNLKSCRSSLSCHDCAGLIH